MNSTKWNEGETTTLIELLEEKQCLWNVCLRYIQKET